MDASELIETLKALQAERDEYRGEGIGVIDTSRFIQWKRNAVACLESLPATKIELGEFKRLEFCVPRVRPLGFTYDLQDEKRFELDMERASVALGSALRRLGGAKPEPAREAPEPPARKPAAPPGGKAPAAPAPAAAAESGTVRELLERLEAAVDKRVGDGDARESVRALLKALAKHPDFAPLLRLGLKDL